MSYILALVLGIFNTILRGAIIKIFYGWFILSHWGNLPNLNFAACLGLSYFLISLSNWNFSDFSKRKDDDFLEKTLVLNFASFIYIAMLFVSGFIVHSFV